ncbi:MAG: ABC transporter permease, partial [Holophagales bacterium]|nr:ABC transporter permease [Holophagales bacterium]
MTPLLRRSALRYLRTHPWQVGATTAGVALAVAVVVGIDIANASAEKAFRRSVDDVAGRATHEIVGGPAGIDEQVYVLLRTSGLELARRAAPVLEGKGRLFPASPGAGTPAAPRAVRVLGVDPFAEPPVRDLTASLSAGGTPIGDGGPEADDESPGAGGDPLTDFLLRPGTVAAGPRLAADLGAAAGDRLRFEGPAGEAVVEMVAVLEPADPLARASTADLLLADIATAQELLGRLGRLDRIDLVVEGGSGATERGNARALAELEAWLPPEVLMRSKASRDGALDQMTRAFRLNLSALSLLALLVGMFLVYNTATFAVVQRRPLLGRLRAMGVTRGELFGLVLLEAAVLGALGTALGLALGIVLSQGLIQLVSQTINDLYFALDVGRVSLAPLSLSKGLLLGLLGPVLAALPPALEATRASPRIVLRRSSLESRARRALPWLGAAGAGLAILGTGLLALPTRQLAPAFAGIFLFVLAFACWVPPSVYLASRAAAPVAAALLGGLGRLAVRGVEGTLSRTGVALAALVIAVATTLGVGVMVASFRATLMQWLEGTLQADIYLTAALDDARGNTRALEPAWIRAVESTPGVAQVSTYRRVEVPARIETGRSATKRPGASGPSGSDGAGWIEAGTAGPGSPGASRDRSQGWVRTQLHAVHMERPAFASFQWSKGGPWAGLPFGRGTGSPTAESAPADGNGRDARTDGIFRRFRAGQGVLISEPYAYRYGLASGDSLDLLTEAGPASFEILAVFYDYASDRGLVMIDRQLYDRHWRDERVQSLGIFLEPGVELEATLDALESRLPAGEMTILPNRELRRASLEIFDRTFRITGVLRLLAVGVAFLGMLSALMALQLERTRELGVLRANGLTPAQVWALVTSQTGFLGLVAG